MTAARALMAYIQRETRACHGFTMRFCEASDLDGRWMPKDVVVGPGATIGISCHPYDIRLPRVPSVWITAVMR